MVRVSFLALWSLLFLGCFADGALAQAQCGLTGETVAISHDGTDGVWFPLETARCVLRDLSLLPLAQQEIRLLSEQVDLSQAQAEDLREALGASEGRSESLGTALAIATRRAVEAGAWWRSPWLWTLVGILIGGGAAVALVVAL